MTVKQAAIRLEVSLSLVYAMIASGKLRCVRIGNRRGAIRILEEHVVEFLERSGSVVASAPTPVRHPKVKNFQL
jgi:excisionase family DNA binding protein